jgi:cytochrome P450/NADPH-cytochrome P450 reductase
VTYRVGDHLGICPKNDEERVERLAPHLGAALDGLFMAPRTMATYAVPKGVVLQVRNVLTNLVDITGRPTVPLLDLLLEKVTDPGERLRLMEIRDVLQTPDGPDSPLRAAIDGGGYDVLRLLDEFPSCTLNIFEFLRVAQPLRPRYYSTSSSPRIRGDGVAHVTVGLETTPVPGLPGRELRGMSSHYVHTLLVSSRVRAPLVLRCQLRPFHTAEFISRLGIPARLGGPALSRRGRRSAACRRRTPCRSGYTGPARVRLPAGCSGGWPWFPS